MHPALSVVFFTTATGAGYGLLAWLGVLSAFGFVPETRLFGLAGLGLALGLITAGLLSSTLHLTHPERAWRAFSQWRSSWLSREGVLSVLTYLPAGLFGFGWVALGRTDGIFAAAGLLSAAFSIATVASTAMIYASLKPVHQWRSPFTLPGYLIYSLMSGAVLLNAMLQLSGSGDPGFTLLACGLLILGWSWKLASWRHNDRLMPATDLNTATALAGGPVRSVEWPHTEENFVLKETGYRIARKHAAKLRILAQAAAFAVPLAISVVALISAGWIAAVASLVAGVSVLPGLLIERWLFFAEAKHTASLYYGR
jgi:sulfite dehydrogenase (quinone) subunit SoeC